ncbi:MAG: error-prone DNA polymerase [Rhizobium sp.]|nr:error-prone DNA polymerase [Rhizobium sp.]
MSGFVELCTTTNFSFLHAASHPEEFIEQAWALDYAGIGIADRNTVAGVVRAYAQSRDMHARARAEGRSQDVRLAIGVRLVFRDGTPDIVVYPTDRAAYGRLTRLLTLGNRDAPKGECWLTFPMFLDHAEGQQAIVIPGLAEGDLPDHRLRDTLAAIRARCRSVWLAARFVFDGEDRRRLRRLSELAFETRARLIATTEPLCHVPQRRALLDVMTCIRQKTTLDEAGRLLAPNAERHLKPRMEMERLYRLAPGAVAETERFLDGLSFTLDDLKFNYPLEMVQGYGSAQEALEAMTWKGAAKRYPHGIPDGVRASLERELEIVAHLKYAPYFLTVADIVRYARHEENILCQGRGSAANSSICYCLEVTEVNPAENNLLFDRFISTERNEPPDIDIDFEHEQREKVIQYVFKKYGNRRAALTSTLICYRRRSALRDVAKAFGYSEDHIMAISRTLHWWSKEIRQEDLRGLGLDLADDKLLRCLQLVEELQDFPRHLSQHVGGIVITHDNLDEIVPIQNARMDDRIVVEWNKDDLQVLTILKVDMLALGMLTCLKKAFDLINATYPDWSPEGKPLDLVTLPKEDPAVYGMLCRADSIGVFQVESRAQMSMLPRLKPKKFYDLVIEVAIVRPGPIQGGMVHPYLKRRQGIEPVIYPKPELEAVLKRTLGVPLFQEQAMQIAIVAAGFSPPEADKLRRAMATFRRTGTIHQLKEKFIQGMIDKGYEPDFAQQCFKQIEGFGEYGFPESHAASFALLVYASSWLKCHYPDVFATALLNSQPMGFYAPSEIVRDAIEHGIDARPPDVNHSDWDNGLEAGPVAAENLHPRNAAMTYMLQSTHALRLGFRQIKGLREDEIRAFVASRGAGYDSVRDVWLRGGLEPSTIERLADADCFRSLGLERRDALWAARGLNRVGGQENLPLFSIKSAHNLEPDFALPPMIMGEHIVEDYRTLGLSLKGHPTAMLRSYLDAERVLPSARLGDDDIRNGMKVRVAGLTLVRQRPGTASGVIFMTLQDETHIANVIVWPKVFERFRAEVLGSRLCAVDGMVQKESGVIHVIAARLYDYSPLLARLSGNEFDIAVTNGDEVRRPVEADSRSHPRDIRHNLSYTPAAGVMPRGRNFH